MAGRRRAPATLGWLAGSMLFTLLVLDVLGVGRGETIRLWIFLACLLTLPAGWAFGSARRAWVADLAVLLLAIQAGVQVMLVTFVGP